MSEETNITLSFKEFYDILFVMDGPAYENKIISQELAKTISSFSSRVHCDYNEEEQLHYVWRLEAWRVNAVRIETLRKESEARRQLYYLRDEAIAIVVAGLNEFLKGAITREEIRGIAAGIILKKDAARAAKFGLNVTDNKWTDLWK